MKLITHSGTFHADDVTACAILKGISDFKEAEVIRTRNQEVISSGTVVFDVGMIHDPTTFRFDHHMSANDPTKPYRDDDEQTPYSSVGLIWKYFGIQYINERHPNLPHESASLIWHKIDNNLIKSVDMIDNGIGGGFRPDDFTSIINDFNPNWDDETIDEDKAFLNAVDFASSVIERRVKHAASLLHAHSLTVEAIERSPDPRYVVLTASLPWEDAVLTNGYDELLYVVNEKDDGWYCVAVPTERGSFDKRKFLPQEWSGLRGKELADATGVDDAIFCHPAEALQTIRGGRLQNRGV